MRDPPAREPQLVRDFPSFSYLQTSIFPHLLRRFCDWRSLDDLKIDTETVPKHKPLENRTKVPATPAATPTPEKGKRKARTSSREAEITILKPQPSKKAKTATTTSSPLHPSRAPSTKTKDVASSASTAASQPVPLPAKDSAALVLTTIVFGSGECGELGLGPKKKVSLKGRVNPFLDPHGKGKVQVVQIACGGMHAIVLTADSKIIAWGVNDENALGRDTKWDSGFRDLDTRSDDGDEDLNPHESTPAEVPSDHFPPDTKFVQVAAGDSCSFVLTNTGFVYGWGAFRVSSRQFLFATCTHSWTNRTLKATCDFASTTAEHSSRLKTNQCLSPV